MSKKSRKRNKKILAAIGIGLGAAALASRKNKSDLASTEDGKSGSTKITGGTNLNDYDAGTKKPVAKPIAKPVKRRDSILGKPDINRMDTSEVDLDYTAPSTTKYKNMDMGLEGFAAKDGGRAGLKSGGRVKGCGKALRGFGKAMKGSR